MDSKKITQVYCDTEHYVNKWLKENSNKEILDIKFSANNEGALIMVIYKEVVIDE